MAYLDYFKSGVSLIKPNSKESWKWGHNGFIEADKFTSIVIPSYYDITYPSRDVILDGVVDKDQLKPIEIKSLRITDDGNVYDKFIVTSGAYYIGQNRRLVLPDQAIKTIFPNDISLTLTKKPSTLFPIMIATFTALNGVITPKRTWEYQPDSDLLDPDIKEWKFSISTNYTIYMPVSPVVTYNSISVLQSSTGTYQVEGGTFYAYQLPEFPVLGTPSITGISSYRIDKVKGIIYSSENTPSITASYTTSPLVVYVPRDIVTNETTFNISDYTDKFAIISNQTKY